MASAGSGKAAQVKWEVIPVRLGGASVSIARLCVEVHLPIGQAGPPLTAVRGWLDTGAPLGVVPYNVQQRGLTWQPIPGIAATWRGIPSDLGWVDVWLQDLTSSSMCGPLPMLAKFPHQDPPGDAVPILIGLEFLLRHQISLVLDPPPGEGVLQVP